MNAARWRAGRTCIPATRARRTRWRAATTSAGSLPSSMTRWSGTGSIQATSVGAARVGAPGSSDGGPSPVGRARRRRRVYGGQTHVGGDPVQPGSHRRPCLEMRVSPPRPQVRLLHQILGFLHRSGHPVAVRKQLAPVERGQLVEPGGVHLWHGHDSVDSRMHRKESVSMAIRWLPSPSRYLHDPKCQPNSVRRGP